MSNQQETPTTSSEDRELDVVTQIDVVPTRGIMKLSDEKLDRAYEITRVIRGDRICIRDKSPRLETRITKGTFVELGEDSRIVPREIYLTEDNSDLTEIRELEDTGEYEQRDICCYEENLTLQTSTAPKTHDPMQWLMEAVKTIHNDIQQIKPAILEIPKLKVAVDNLMENQAKLEAKLD